MATKANPGQFDCYEKAEPDEPMFVLLARDKHAPALVWLWAVLRELDQEKPEKVEEARLCAVNMIEWQHNHGKQTVGVGIAAMAGMLELTRAANYAAKDARNSPCTIDQIRAFFTATEVEKAVVPTVPPEDGESFPTDQTRPISQNRDAPDVP